MKRFVFRPPLDHPLSKFAGTRGQIISTNGASASIRLESHNGNRGGINIMTHREFLKDE